jgi:hypothetical protein
MRSQVQVLAGPLPALTSRNAGRLVRSPVGGGMCRVKNAYLGTIPCHEQHDDGGQERRQQQRTDRSQELQTSAGDPARFPPWAASPRPRNWVKARPDRSVLQAEPELEGHLALSDLAAGDDAADLRDLEPVQVAERPIRPGDRVADRLVDPLR